MDVLTVTKRKARPCRGPASVLGWRPRRRVPVGTSGAVAQRWAEGWWRLRRMLCPARPRPPGHTRALCSLPHLSGTPEAGAQGLPGQTSREDTREDRVTVWAVGSQRLTDWRKLSKSLLPRAGDAPPYDDISRGPHVPWESSSLTVAPVHPRCRCSAVSAAGLQGVSAQGDPWVLLCSPHCCGPSAPDHGLTRLAPRWARVSQDPHAAALGRVSTKPRTSRDVTASPGRPPKLVVTANRKAGRSARTPSESTQL